MAFPDVPRHYHLPPEDLELEHNVGAINVDIQRVLQMPFLDLVHIHMPMYQIYRHLSIQDRWKHFASILGLPMKDICLHEALQTKKPYELPAQTFLLNFLNDRRGCTFEMVYKALDDMATFTHDGELRGMVDSLFKTAYQANR